MHDCILCNVSKCILEIEVIQMHFISPSMYAWCTMKQIWYVNGLTIKSRKRCFEDIIYRIQLSTSHSPPKPTSGVATDSIKICGKLGESSIPDVVDRYQQYIMYEIYYSKVYMIPIKYNIIKNLEKARLLMLLTDITKGGVASGDVHQMPRWIYEANTRC